ncbi:enoyl-CoA hydratase-related protein, partial [Acinetobacter baumannii]
MTVDQPVLMSVEGNIATLTLNRPEKLNALSYALIDTFQQHLDAIERDDSIRVVILTGSGKAF